MQDNRKSDLTALRRSRLFFQDWYLFTYPDVAATNVKPLHHFYDFAHKERRDPSPFFSSDYYLKQNDDVRRAQVNPLLHYIKVGYLEGRRPNDWFEPKTHLSNTYELKSDEIPLTLFVELLTRVSPQSEVMNRDLRELGPLLDQVKN